MEDKTTNIFIEEIETHHSIEMLNDSNLFTVQTSDCVNIEELTKDDPDPKYCIVEVIRTCTSRNNRTYTANVVQEIANNLVGVTGYLGHKNPDGFGWEFREPQAIYVGSKLVQEGNDTVCYGKAYLYKGSQLREWIPTSISMKKPITVSISADVKAMRVGEQLVIDSLSVLESVDFCNPNTEGIPTSRVHAVVNEMKGEEPDMDRNEVIQTLTIEEIQSAPAYVQPDYSEYTTKIDEMTSDIEAKDAKITEMTEEIAGKDTKITELEAQVSEMTAKVAEMEAKEIEDYKALKIAEQVEEANREIFAKRISGNTKEEIDTQIAEMIELINAFARHDNVPAPADKRVEEKDALKDRVKNLFSAR